MKLNLAFFLLSIFCVQNVAHATTKLVCSERGPHEARTVVINEVAPGVFTADLMVHDAEMGSWYTFRNAHVVMDARGTDTFYRADTRWGFNLVVTTGDNLVGIATYKTYEIDAAGKKIAISAKTGQMVCRDKI